MKPHKKHRVKRKRRSKIGSSQNKLQKILEKLLNLKAESNYRKFSWLRDKSNLEIDIWFNTIKFAVEYDGKQHFESVRRWGGKKKLLAIQERDKLKNKLISEHVDEVKFFVRFKYDESISEESVKEKLIMLGILK